MTDKYTYKTYGLAQVYDKEIGACREPMTPAELERARQYGELLKKSFTEVGSCPTKQESE